MIVLRILVTGSRGWTDSAAIRDALTHAWCDCNERESQPVVVVHGAARGADTLAAEIAPTLGMDVEPHPAKWRVYGKAAGPMRNAEMVALGADVCLAFPIGDSPGTRNCIDLARKAGISTRVFEVAASATDPVMPISRDRIYPRCVWCRGENYMPAVLAYSAGEIPCAAAGGCGRYLPVEYRRAARDATREAHLDAMVREAAELGLYETTAEPRETR